MHLSKVIIYPQGGFFSDVAAFTHGPANNLKPLTEMNRSLFILLKEKSCNTGAPFSSISVVMLGETSPVGPYQSWSTTTVSLHALSSLCLAQLHRAEDVYLQPLSRQPLYLSSGCYSPAPDHPGGSAYMCIFKLHPCCHV